MSASAPYTHAFGGWDHPEVYASSLGGGALSGLLHERLRSLAEPPASRRIARQSVFASSIPGGKEHQLFNVVAALKIAVSEVSMHLPSAWRKVLFEKIDDLHEPDDWEDSDRLADLESFKTFLRTVLQQGPMKRMSLGISDDGRILAGWTRDKDSLSLAFLANDLIRWSVVRHLDGGETESAAGQTTLARLPEVLRPYKPEVWFGYADDTSAV